VARIALKYGTVLIGTYLAVAYATGAGKIINSSSKGAVNVIRALQAR
jgi:hypothetical protein